MNSVVLTTEPSEPIRVQVCHIERHEREQAVCQSSHCDDCNTLRHLYNTFYVFSLYVHLDSHVQFEAPASNIKTMMKPLSSFFFLSLLRLAVETADRLTTSYLL
jgi:hypothetical protein